MVSIVVVSYNPVLEKMRMTLKSILLQTNIEYQIIIADDGSKNNLFEDIRLIFEESKFTNYQLIANSKNAGTVQNVIRAMKYCSGKYTKLLSPGDCLYGFDILNEWVINIEASNAVVSFSDTVDYHRNEQDKIELISRQANPSNYKAFIEGGEKLRRTYLIKNDICIGASTLVLTEKMKEYLKLIGEKVKYAEDNIYRLMIFREEKATWFAQNAILYEVGDGVSTSGKSEWVRRLQEDWKATDDIILAWIEQKDKKDKIDRVLYDKIYNRRTPSYVQKVIQFIFSLPGHFQYRRLSPIDKKTTFLQEID